MHSVCTKPICVNGKNATSAFQDTRNKLTVRGHKHLKGLKDQNLRDHMSKAELLLTALAELSTRQIAEARNATGFGENARAGREGGAIAGKARRELEEKPGQRVVAGDRFLPPKKELGKALPEPAKGAEAGS